MSEKPHEVHETNPSGEKAANDVFADNREAVATTNAHILKWMALIATINMSVLAIAGPFLAGFAAAQPLYLGSAILSALFCLFCFLVLDKHPLPSTTPLFYLFIGVLCAYSTILSVYYYPDIHGVTVVAMFALVPTVILDRSWRVNTILVAYFAAFAVAEFALKSSGLASDDVVTCGSLLLFGSIIGNYLRTVRIRSIDQQRILVDQQSLLEYQRDRDALTGLPNRRSLFKALAELERSEIPLTGTIMIDIDDFKNYNDEHGHQAGDACLTRCGLFLAQFAREHGLAVYRYGGEEFLALYRADNPHPLPELAELLVCNGRLLKKYPDDVDDVTVSIGYATREPESDIGCERLITMADKALYEAKRQGKNRAVAYNPSLIDSFADCCPSLRQGPRS